MRLDTFKCDVCGQIKGENNHWFRIDTAALRLELHAWGAVTPSASTVDLCSDQCVMKVVQQWLTAQAQGSGRRFDEGRSAGVVSIGGLRAS